MRVDGCVRATPLGTASAASNDIEVYKTPVPEFDVAKITLKANQSNLSLGKVDGKHTLLPNCTPGLPSGSCNRVFAPDDRCYGCTRDVTDSVLLYPAPCILHPV